MFLDIEDCWTVSLCLYSQIGKGVHYNQNQGDGGTGGDQGETASHS